MRNNMVKMTREAANAENTSAALPTRDQRRAPQEEIALLLLFRHIASATSTTVYPRLI